MLQTKVSIILPYSKDRGYLDKAIESIHNQNFAGDIEIIHSKSRKRTRIIQRAVTIFWNVRKRNASCYSISS